MCIGLAIGNAIKKPKKDDKELLVQKMQKQQHIDEALKACDQMVWVG